MRFLLTQELGRLARWLRLLGYDTAYALPQETAVVILIRALREHRGIVTRDKRFKGHPGVRILWVESDQVRQQLREFLKGVGARLKGQELFTRCLKCNSVLEGVKKEAVQLRVPPFVYKTVDNFVRCPQCDQIFWAGTHLALAEDFLRDL